MNPLMIKTMNKKHRLPVLLISLAACILGLFLYSHLNMRAEDAEAATGTYSRERSNSIMRECVEDAKIAFTKGTDRDQSAWDVSYDDGAIAILAAELFRARAY